MILSKALFVGVIFNSFISANSLQNFSALGDQYPTEHQNKRSVLLKDFIEMTSQQIQNVHDVIVPLSESYFPLLIDKKLDIFNQKLEQNLNITVVLDCGNETQIDHFCLMRVRKMCNIRIHAPRVTSVGEGFLAYCCGITELDLKPLSKVTSVDNAFLFHCSGLTYLDLNPLSRLKHTNFRFLAECHGLKTLDLSFLFNATRIGENFLYGCSGLTKLDFTPLSKVKDIRGCFLSECIGLTELNLEPLSKVTSIGDGFLCGCCSLTRKTVQIPENWHFKFRLPESIFPKD